MKRLFTAMALAGALCAAQAADDKKAPSPAQTAQQTKMATCNKEAAGMKGDERKAFMKDCLSSKPAGDKTAQKAGSK